MKRHKLFQYFFTIFACLQFNIGNCNNDIKDLLKKIDNEIVEQRFINASIIIDRILDTDTLHIQTLIRKAIVLKESNQYNESIKILQKVLEKISPKEIKKLQVDPYFLRIHEILGDCYHFNKEYVKSISCYNNYLSTIEKNNYSERFRIDKKIKTSEFAKIPLIKSDLKVFKVEIGFDNFHSIGLNEGKEFFFQLKENINILNTKNIAKLFLSSIGQTQIDEYNRIYTSGNLKGTIIDGCFSSDKKLFYFTVRVVEKDNKVKELIYESRMDGKELIDIKLLPELINTGNNSQPCILKTEQNNDRLYFISDRKGGKGKTDVWYVDRMPDGTFSNLKNFSEVNTEETESGIFYSKNEQCFYFSSNGLPGFGGYDIFKFKEGIHKTPENAGSPFNTEYDETGIVSFSQNEALVISNRSINRFIEFNNHSLYLIAKENRIEEAVTVNLKENYGQLDYNSYKPNYKVVISGFIKAIDSQLPLVNTKIFAYSVNSQKVETAVGVTQTDKDGYYHFTFNENIEYRIEVYDKDIDKLSKIVSSSESELKSNVYYDLNFDINTNDNQLVSHTND